MGILDSYVGAGILCTFLAAFSVVHGIRLRCLSCQGQSVYECLMSAMVSFCDKGEECRFRMLFHRHIPSTTMAWFQAGCATVAECRAPDSEFYAHFCCRINYCNYLPVGR